MSCIETLQKKLDLVPIDDSSNNVAIIYKQYYVKVIGHGNDTCKSNKSFDEIIDENDEFIKRLAFKITEK